MQTAEKPAIPARGGSGALQERATLRIYIVVRALIVFQHHPSVLFMPCLFQVPVVLRISAEDRRPYCCPARLVQTISATASCQGCLVRRAVIEWATQTKPAGSSADHLDVPIEVEPIRLIMPPERVTLPSFR